MDIEVARTLVAVVESGSFLAAAERLNVTQSTVSARIKDLELQLGRRLLDRGRHGARPTEAGRRFLHHAGVLVRVWQQARQELSLPENASHVLTAGAQVSLWDRLLGAWIGWMRSHHPAIALSADVAPADVLMRRVVDGILDLAVLYTPQSGPGLIVRPLFEDTLILVADRTDHAAEPEHSDIYCDWGPEFRAAHARTFPDATPPMLTVGTGTLALTHLLDHGGGAYLPERLARPALEARQLFVIADAPRFPLPAFVVHAKRDDVTLADAVDGLFLLARTGV